MKRNLGMLLALAAIVIITGCVSGYHVRVPIEQQQTRARLTSDLDAKLTLAGFEHVNTPDFAVKDFGMSPISWRRKVLQSSIQRFWYGSEYVNVYITSTETYLNIGIFKTKGSSEGHGVAEMVRCTVQEEFSGSNVTLETNRYYWPLGSWAR